jgi:hypothetical protein
VENGTKTENDWRAFVLATVAATAKSASITSAWPPVKPETNMNENKVWVVTVPSAYRAMHQCFLGKGATKHAALEDAYGPRRAWGNATKASARQADVYETDAATADSMEHEGVGA